MSNTVSVYIRIVVAPSGSVRLKTHESYGRPMYIYIQRLTCDRVVVYKSAEQLQRNFNSHKENPAGCVLTNRSEIGIG